MDDLPTCRAVPFESSAGGLDPRSKSLWLSLCHVVGANSCVRWRPGDSSITESLLS